MNCCDYDCNQGRNCPARATPLGGVAPSTGEGFWPAFFKMRKRADQERREWVGLTDEEIESLWDHGLYVHCSGITALRAITRALEAKLREKNT